MKILNLLSTGTVGGIEVLCKNIGKKAMYDNTFCFLFSEGKICQEMREDNTTVVSLVKQNGSRKITLHKIKQLIKLTKEHDVVVTHHANIPAQLVYFIMRNIVKEKKYVMVAHSCFETKLYYTSSSKLKNEFFHFLLKRNLKKSDGIIFVSEAGKRSYQQEFKFDEKKSKVIYNGVPGEFVKNLKSTAMNNSSNIKMLFVGRLIELKGVQHLIEAVANMVKDGIECELTIVGDGPYKKNLEQLVIDKSLRNYVTFAGQQRDIKSYYDKADIFVYPSVCQEVFGISIVEAMASGIPCVAFNVGGIPEIIVEGYNGALALQGNAKDLQSAIIRVWNMQREENSLYEIRGNCFDTAKKFSIDNTINNLEVFYKELLENKE